MITYHCNFMGPISLDWFRERGFTQEVTEILKYDSRITDAKAGDVITLEEITQHWAGGRIDVMGTGELFGVEIGLPVMKSDDWSRFSQWIWSLKTETVWTLKEIVDEYEKTHPKITWYNQEIER